MNRDQLEHLIRAAAAITNEYEIMVVGSQSILGSMPNAPAELLKSVEADLYPLKNPSLADIIDGAIGESSPFEKSFGYYAQGVGPETAVMPAGWMDRLVKVQNRNTDGKVGYCPEVHDLAASKLYAHREKDLEFVDALIRHSLLNTRRLLERVREMPIEDERKEIMAQWIGRHRRESGLSPD